MAKIDTIDKDRHDRHDRRGQKASKFTIFNPKFKKIDTIGSKTTKDRHDRHGRTWTNPIDGDRDRQSATNGMANRDESTMKIDTIDTIGIKFFNLGKIDMAELGRP